MNKLLLALMGKLKRIRAAAPLLSKQLLTVVAAAVIVAAGAVYLVNTVFLDNSAINSGKSATTRTAGKAGALIAAVAEPLQKIRDIFHYSNELDVLPLAALPISRVPDSAEKTNSVAVVAPSYGNDVILKGIAKSGLTKYALIIYGGKTQIYRVGESFGPYNVANIGDGSVGLNSPIGPLIINQQQLLSLAKQPKEVTGGGPVGK